MSRFPLTAALLTALTAPALADPPAGPPDERVIKGHTNRVEAVAVSPDGARVATGSRDKTIRVWDTATGERQVRIPHTHEVYCLAFTPDGRTLLSGGRDGAVTFWDAATWEKRRTVEVGKKAVGFVAVSPTGDTFATLGVDEYGTKLWDAASGKLRADLRGDASDRVNAVAFSPDGRKLATAGRDSATRIWDAATGREVDSLKAHDGEVYAVAFSPDGKRLATAGADKTVVVWDVKGGNVVRPVLEGHTGAAPRFVAFRPDGRVVSRTWLGETLLWKHPGGRPTVLARGREAGLGNYLSDYYSADVATSSDGGTLFFGSGEDVRVQTLPAGPGRQD